MRLIGLFCLWIILSAFSPGQQIVAFNPQQRPDNASAGLPAVDDSLIGGGYPLAGGNCAEWGHRVPCYSHLSTTRAQTVSSYCTSTDGMLAAVNANVTRLCNGNGALIEEARTNSALWARDMTNAAWVKVGMGNALNATGADGTANSATTLTATGTASSCTASCTILQTLTLGSTADTYSVYLMRVTGSGAVNITINNLVGTTACTLVTSGFTRCTVTATLANPVIGVQLTTLNDVVVADFNQLEAGSFVTSPIPTTTVAVARATDQTALIGAVASMLSAGAGAIAIKFRGFPSIANQAFAALLGSNTSAGLIFINSTSTTVLRSADTNNANAFNNTNGTGNLANPFGAGLSWATGTRSFVWGQTSSMGVVSTDAHSLINSAMTTPTLGSLPNGTLFADSNFVRVTGFSAKIPDATLTAMAVQ